MTMINNRNTGSIQWHYSGVNRNTIKRLNTSHSSGHKNTWFCQDVCFRTGAFGRTRMMVVSCSRKNIFCMNNFIMKLWNLIYLT